MRTPLAQLAAAALLAPALLVLGSAPAHATPRTCHGQGATIVGTSRPDTIHGTPGHDVIVGGGQADVIDGGKGHDVICGNRGRDHIVGGGGDDAVWGQIGDDWLKGGAGDDSLDGGPGHNQTTFIADAGDDYYHASSAQDEVWYDAAPRSISVDLGAGTASGWGDDTLALGNAYVDVIGSTHADTLIGSDRTEQFDGYGGFDTLEGKAGNDVLVARKGTILGGDGHDYLGLGGATHPDSRSRMDGGPGNDELAFQGLAQVLGGPGDDVVSHAFQAGAPYAEFDVDGGEGTDRLDLYNLGESGGYPFNLDLAAGTLEVEGSQETLTGFENLYASGAAAWFDLTGTNGPNTFEINTFGNEPITVHGLAGDDTMNGAGGDDVLDGGPGTDTADARSGTDTCTSIENPTSCEVVEP